jgi:hypothetical protein
MFKIIKKQTERDPATLSSSELLSEPQQLATGESGSRKIQRTSESIYPSDQLSNSSSETREATTSELFNQGQHSSAGISRSRKRGASELFTQNDRSKRKNDGWSKHETSALEQELRAIRAEENAQGVVDTLKDTKLWTEVSARILVNHGVNRTPAACKTQWSRNGRAASGFDERFKQNPNMLATSVQKLKGLAGIDTSRG